MDLTDPTRAVTPTLDGPVLAVLGAAGRPLTVGQVASASVRGSEIGVRRSLDRLVRQGVVRATLVGRNRVHELNRDHVAARVAELLAGLRTELWHRLRTELDGWRIKPVYACVFGSAARQDGDEESDIDLLLVHPPFPGERSDAAVKTPIAVHLADLLAQAVLGPADFDPIATWEDQLDRLRGRVEGWTGNAVQVVDMSFFEWRHPPKAHQPLLAEIRRDGVELTRSLALTAWPPAEDRGASSFWDTARGS